MKREKIAHIKRQLTRAVADVIEALDKAHEAAKAATERPIGGEVAKLLTKALRIAGAGEKRTYTRRAETVARGSAPQFPRTKNHKVLERYSYVFGHIVKRLKKEDGLTARKLLYELRRTHVDPKKLRIGWNHPERLSKLLKGSMLGRQLLELRDDRFYLRPGATVPELPPLHQTGRPRKDAPKRAAPRHPSKHTMAEQRRVRLFEKITEMLTSTPGLTPHEMIEVLKHQKADLKEIGLDQDPSNRPMTLGRVLQTSKLGVALFRANADKTYSLKKGADVKMEAAADAVATVIATE